MTPSTGTSTRAARLATLVGFALAATFAGACGAGTVTAPAPTAAPATEAPADDAADGADAAEPAGGVCALVDPSLASATLGGATLDGGTSKHNTVFDGDGCVFRDTAS